MAAAVAMVAPASAQTAPIEPVTGLPIPLLSYEIIVNFKNGCSAIVPNDSSAPYYSSTNWYGGCRASLADGAGYIYYDIKDVPKAFTPTTFRWGHPMPPASPGTADYVRLPRGPGRDAAETISLGDPNVPEKYSTGQLTDRNGAFVPAVIASRYLDGDTRQDAVLLRMMKNPCPSIYKVEKELTMPTVNVALTSAQQQKLLPICQAAIARLRAEGVVKGERVYWPSDPFSKVDYGYYFIVYEERSVSPRQGNSYGASTNDTVSNATLCPNPTTLVGCEVVWRKMMAPLVARRDAIVSGWAATQAADAADLERRFAPIDAAFKRTIAARAARRVRAGARP